MARYSVEKDEGNWEDRNFMQDDEEDDRMYDKYSNAEWRGI